MTQKPEMTELQLYENWLSEYWKERHQTWSLRANAEQTPAGKRYCRDKMFELIRTTIAQIRQLRADAETGD